MKSERRYLRYFFYRCLLALLRILPEFLCYGFVHITAHLHTLLRVNRAAREAVSANLRIILGPDATERQIARETHSLFRAHGEFLMEWFARGRYFPKILDERCHTIGEAPFLKDLKERGVVLVSGHIGNWELGPAYLSSQGHRTFGIAMRHPDELLDRLFMELRQNPNQEIERIDRAMRRSVQAVREDGRILIVMGDRPFGEKGIEVSMFGRKVYFPQGPARMAIRAGAALYPGFVVRRPNGAYCIQFGERIEAPETGGARQKAAAMTQAYAEQLERVIRRHPSQWFIFYEVFDPPGGVTQDPILQHFLERQAVAATVESVA